MREPPWVYLDTSAWNALHDWMDGRSRRRLAHQVLLFSSCNLDEFALASPGRCKQLASFAWQVTNRRKLWDHVELTVAEISAFQHEAELDYFDSQDRGFLPVWRALATAGVDAAMRRAVSEQIQAGKRFYRDWIKLGRELFHPFFSAASRAGVSRDWGELLDELYQGVEMRQALRETLTGEGLLGSLPRPAELDLVPWEAMPCTACWLEYHVAMYYQASFGTKALGRADLGDQVDFRHSCYAGMADVFVTGDGRMHEILETMIKSRTARIVDANEFITALSSGGL